MAVGQTICGQLLSALLCLDGVFGSAGQRCWMSKSEYIFSDKVETAFSCPRAGDPDHFTECCGPSWQRKCCAASKAEFGPIGGGGVISFFGIVTGIVIFICCLVLICCCCTPCCLLAKQRNRRGLVTITKLLQLFFKLMHFLHLTGFASTSSSIRGTGSQHASSHPTSVQPPGSRTCPTWLP